MTDERGPLTEAERALLAHVPAPAPPADFAARVVARAAAEHARPRAEGARPSQSPDVWTLEEGQSPRGSPSPRAWTLRGPASRRAAAALLAVAAGAAALAWGLMRADHSGHGALAASTARREAALGDRGVAVVEPGAALSWSVDADGAARVEQSAGDVFYRVEPGGPFVVRTGAGEVRVTGTCFRVEVQPVRTIVSHLATGAASAALAVVATLTVYEGQVVASSGGAERTVSAGERVELAGARAPEPRPTVSTAARALAAGPAAPAPAATTPALPAGLTPEQLYAAHGQLAREADGLRARVGQLEVALADATQERRRSRVFDIDPEELRAMAERCELRWDVVPLSEEDVGLGVKEAERLSIGEEERAAASRLMAASQKQLRDAIHALYTEVTGDPSVGSLTAEAMIDEIVDKTAPPERQQVFQRLARERAGVASPPSAAPSPYERLFRALTTSGDALEAELARELGPETARKLRESHGGWGNKSRSTQGCPGEDDR